MRSLVLRQLSRQLFDNKMSIQLLSSLDQLKCSLRIFVNYKVNNQGKTSPNGSLQVKYVETGFQMGRNISKWVNIGKYWSTLLNK